MKVLKQAAAMPRSSMRVRSETSNTRARSDEDDDDMTGNEGSTQPDVSERNSKRLKASNYRNSLGNEDEDDCQRWNESG
jgi:hypothetical protein